MLNTVLTVRAHQANSHQGQGWEQFTDAIIHAVNAQDRPIESMLWGRPAKSKSYAKEPEPFGFESSTSKPIVRIPWLLWVQAF